MKTARAKLTVVVVALMLLSLAFAATLVQAEGPEGGQAPSAGGAPPAPTPGIATNLLPSPPIRSRSEVDQSALSAHCRISLPAPQAGTNRSPASGQCDAGTVSLLAEAVTGWAVVNVAATADVGVWNVELADPSKPHFAIQEDAKYAEPPLLQPGAGRPR